MEWTRTSKSKSMFETFSAMCPEPIYRLWSCEIGRNFKSFLPGCEINRVPAQSPLNKKPSVTSPLWPFLIPLIFRANIIICKRCKGCFSTLSFRKLTSGRRGDRISGGIRVEVDHERRSAVWNQVELDSITSRGTRLLLVHLKNSLLIPNTCKILAAAKSEHC